MQRDARVSVRVAAFTVRDCVVSSSLHTVFELDSFMKSLELELHRTGRSAGRVSLQFVRNGLQMAKVPRAFSDKLMDYITADVCVVCEAACIVLRAAFDPIVYFVYLNFVRCRA